MNSYQTGLWGEWRAARYLKKQGLRIIEKRYRTRHGEIDLIAWDGDTLVFVEVKMRAKGKIGDGAAAVNGQKRRSIRYAAQIYLQSHPVRDVRFDVIEITLSGIRHIRHAF